MGKLHPLNKGDIFPLTLEPMFPSNVLYQKRFLLCAGSWMSSWLGRLTLLRASL